MTDSNTRDDRAAQEEYRELNQAIEEGRKPSPAGGSRQAMQPPSRTEEELQPRTDEG